MITTTDSYQMPFYFRSAGSRVYNWRCVDLDSNFPYFFIEYEYREDDIGLKCRKMVSNVSDLVQFFHEIKQDHKSTLKQIAMLAPPWVNRSDCWEMENLSEILHASFGDDAPLVPVYITKDGRKILESFSTLELDKALHVKSVLSLLM